MQNKSPKAYTIFLMMKDSLFFYENISFSMFRLFLFCFNKKGLPQDVKNCVTTRKADLNIFIVIFIKPIFFLLKKLLKEFLFLRGFSLK